MKNIHPRKVSPLRSFAWLREAFEITTANCIWAIVVIIPVMLLSALMPSWLIMFAMPIVVTVLLFGFCILACSYDTRGSSRLLHALPGLSKTIAYVIVIELMAAMFYGFSFASSASMAKVYINVGSNLSDFSPGAISMIVMSAGWIAMPLGTFFLMPLILFLTGGKFFVAHEISNDGFKLNRWLWIVSLLGAIICLTLSLINGLFVILVLPLTSAFLYVAYRDVYMHTSVSVRRTDVATTSEPALNHGDPS